MTIKENKFAAKNVCSLPCNFLSLIFTTATDLILLDWLSLINKHLSPCKWKVNFWSTEESLVFGRESLEETQVFLGWTNFIFHSWKGTLHIYFPWRSEIWKFVHLKKVMFSEGLSQGNITLRVNKCSYFTLSREINDLWQMKMVLHISLIKDYTINEPFLQFRRVW